jgi:hypothetical protein
LYVHRGEDSSADRRSAATHSGRGRNPSEHRVRECSGRSANDRRCRGHCHMTSHRGPDTSPGSDRVLGSPCDTAIRPTERGLSMPRRSRFESRGAIVQVTARSTPRQKRTCLGGRRPVGSAPRALGAPVPGTVPCRVARFGLIDRSVQRSPCARRSDRSEAPS